MMNKQKDKKILSKIIFNIAKRKTNYFRRNIHINHKPTNIKICHVKSWNDLTNKKDGYESTWIESNICFFLYHQSWQQIIKNIKNTKTFNCDIVFTDCKTNKIVDFFPNIYSLQEYDVFYNVWFFEKNKKNFFNLKKDDFIFTR